MAVAKSPFLIFQEFISPKTCETIVDKLGFYSPDTDQQGHPIKMFRFHEESERIIFDRLQAITPEIINYYGADNYRGTEQIIFEYITPGTACEPICENSNYIRKKWVQTKDRNISAVLFLSDHNEIVPFDSEYEVYGGKLEFPQHHFGFNPTRGTLIVYPSGPHFINATANIAAGELFQARIHIATQTPYLYQPDKFPGDYRSWFKNLL